MLLSSSKWPFKTSSQGILVYVHTPPTNAAKDMRLLDQSSRNFCRIYRVHRRWKFLIRFVILPTVVECQRWEWRRGVSIFANTRHKLVIMATSLEQAVAILIYYYKAHCLLYACWKFGKDQSIDSGGNNTNVRILRVNIHPPPSHTPRNLKDLLK